MKLYRLNVTKDGQNIQVRKWYCDVRFGGKRFRLPLFESKKASEDFAALLELMLGQFEAGRSYDKRVELWLNQISPAFVTKFVRWGLLDASRAAQQSCLTEQIDQWRDSLLASGTGKAQADQNHHRAARVFTEAGFGSLADIKADKVTLIIGQLHKTVHKKNADTGKIELARTGPASTFSKLHYTRACKQFTKWATANGRLTADPLAHLTMKNVRVENQRRALTVEELSCLLTYLEKAPAIWQVPGPERALVYELAVQTGLRRDEIKSLTRRSIDFDRLTVKVEAAETKNKKPALLPVKAALMDRIKAHLSGKLPAAPAFRLPEAAAKMLRKDMESARAGWIEAVKKNAKEHRRRVDSDFLKVVTHEGKVDFHSLRHTFGTMLAASGVHPKVAMDLMRHSDINLTMALYTHSNQEQATVAIDALPDLITPVAETKEKKQA